MGWLCNQVVKVGCFAIADFICPTPATRAAFLHGGDAFVIWLDRIQVGTFADTNRMFVAPDRFDLRVTAHGPPEYWAEQAMVRLRPVFDPKNRRRQRSALLLWQRSTVLARINENGAPPL
jgi:adenylylsulfate kinase